MKTETRGGSRKGSGRKPGVKRTYNTFTLSAEAVAVLATLPAGERSRFVDAAILGAKRSK
jgi:hypothetical protein